MITGSDFIPISVATLLPSEEGLGLRLFKKSEDSDRTVLYRDAGYPLTDSDIKRLRAKGIRRLFIAREARETYQQYVRELAVNTEEDCPLEARIGALCEVVRDVTRTAFSKGDLNETVDAAAKLGELAARIVMKDDFAADDLFRVLHHDYATFTHSANVAFYCGILGAELGCPREEVEKITAGGLLHDLGKLEIDESILCKPGKLDDREFRVIRTHPVLGFRKLAHRDDLTEGQVMMAYQHHERLDGKGYPVGCVENEIHPWAKMCSVVDVFEALTSQRPYRKPMPKLRALELQERDSGVAFDSEILECWNSIIRRDLVK